MKKIISHFLILALVLSLFCGCQSGNPPTKTEGNPLSSQDSAETEGKTEEKTEESQTNPASVLDGKKVIFVGNSYTYYGNCVITKDVSVKKQSQRQNDKGYFYQICKANGANVNVTNWTFASHGLSDLFQSCAAGKSCNGADHKSDLTDPVYDYVFLQERSGEDFTSQFVVENVERAAEFFRGANPNVKIFFLAQSRLYEWQVGWMKALKEISEKGVTVLEWGALVEDVIDGKVQVPGSTTAYNRNSFVIKQSKDDGYHPNMLSGYITAQMAYCAITGESAVGQDYAFCTNASLQSAFNITNYISKYYKYQNAVTNMKEIFQSPADMKGLQELMDQYLASEAYKSY
ncbi:MAG: hypothetical protein IKD31_06980 [Clostridia bacterium]|nr:hypothetical protein [Clostridia bacterium]